jgi:cytochrome P450
MSEAMTVDDVDLEDLDLWAGPPATQEQAFRLLRAQRPRAFFYERDIAGRRRESGYWSLTRYDDIVEVSRRPDDFSSAKGTNIVDLPPELTEFMGSIIAMDDPRHARLRRIVARGFTPRTLDTLKSDVEAVAADIVAGIADRGECDFVAEVAALLPLRIIVDLMGIPRSEEKFILDTTNVILGATDPEYVPDQTGRGVRTALLQAGEDLAALVRELAEDRMKNPRNDLTTTLVVAESKEEVLTPQELASFFILLVGAGNETTRNAIAHGLLALSEHPDQREAWQADYEAIAPAAVEEIVRWASPVLHMRRTVTADGVRLGDQEFAAGDKIVVWYYSANRDESVFDDPFRFDLRRRPNEHIGFGAPGPHFCLGAHLARREMTVAFRELFRQLPDIHAAGDPEFLRNNFIHGIKHLTAEFTATGPSSQKGTTS